MEPQEGTQIISIIIIIKVCWSFLSFVLHSIIIIIIINDLLSVPLNRDRSSQDYLEYNTKHTRYTNASRVEGGR